MLINETPPSVRRIETDRDDAYAFEITGQIAATDIENMFGLLEGAYELHDQIDVLVLVHDYEGFDWSALWHEETYLDKARAFKHIRKYAFVGGAGWMKTGATLVRPFMPMEIRQFDLDELDEAWAWIGANPRPQAE